MIEHNAFTRQQLEDLELLKMVGTPNTRQLIKMQMMGMARQWLERR